MRLEWLDILKGIGIIFVVLGHSISDASCILYIFSFHMPLFFFIAGYCCYYSEAMPPTEFIKKRAHRLLIPYFFFSLVSLLIAPLISVQIGTVKETVVQILFWNGRFIWNDPLWFLICLFFVEVIFAQVKNKKSSIIAICLICCGLIGYMLSNLDFKPPFGLHIAFVGLVYYGLGFLCNSFNVVDKLSMLSPKRTIAACFLLFHAWLFASNGFVDMYDSAYGENYLLFYAIALLGVFAYLFCAQIAGSYQVISFLGRNTLVILGTHYIVLRLITLVLEELSYSENATVIFGSFKTAVTLILLYPAIIFFNKILPGVVGHRVHSQSDILVANYDLGVEIKRTK